MIHVSSPSPCEAHPRAIDCRSVAPVTCASSQSSGATRRSTPAGCSGAHTGHLVVRCPHVAVRQGHIRGARARMPISAGWEAGKPPSRTGTGMAPPNDSHSPSCAPFTARYAALLLLASRGRQLSQSTSSSSDNGSFGRAAALSDGGRVPAALLRPPGQSAPPCLGIEACELRAATARAGRRRRRCDGGHPATGPGGIGGAGNKTPRPILLRLQANFPGGLRALQNETPFALKRSALRSRGQLRRAPNRP